MQSKNTTPHKQQQHISDILTPAIGKKVIVISRAENLDESAPSMYITGTLQNIIPGLFEVVNLDKDDEEPETGNVINAQLCFSLEHVYEVRMETEKGEVFSTSKQERNNILTPKGANLNLEKWIRYNENDIVIRLKV